MGNYDGSQLQTHTSKSKLLIKTATNLLEHCIQVSSEQGTNADVKRYLTEEVDNPFRIVGDSLFINAIQSNSAARAYIVENDKAVVIAFRGSGVKGNHEKTLQNAITDLRINLIKDTNFPGKVHAGFSSDYLQIQEEIIRRVRSLNLKKKKVYITGFSLGAALAVLCAYHLKKTLQRDTIEINPQVFLFAPPGVGNHKFTLKYEEYISSIFRFAHKKDLVAQIPHGILCEYKATGNKLLVFDDEAKQVHHNKIELLIKIKRNWLFPIVVASIYKLIKTFKDYHKPEYYKKKLVRLYLNYEDNIKPNSSLKQSAMKQYQESQQHCINK